MAMLYASLYVSDLAKSCNEEDLYQLFQSIGSLITAKIIQRNDHHATAMVTLPSFEVAERAKQHLDGCVFMGKKIRLSWANSVPAPFSQYQTKVINSIYIRYCSRRIPYLIRVEDLERIFAPFGLMTEVCIKDSHMDHRTGRQSGLAFVHFASTKDGMHAAFRAVSGIDGNTVDDISFRAELSRNLLRQFDQGVYSQRGGVDGFPTDIPAPLPPSHFSGAYANNPSIGGVPTHPPAMPAPAMRMSQPSYVPPQSSYPMQNYPSRDMAPMGGHFPSRPPLLGYEQGLPGRSYSTPSPHSSLSHSHPFVPQQTMPAKSFSVQFPLSSHPAGDNRRFPFGQDTTADLMSGLLSSPSMEPLPAATSSAMTFPLSSCGGGDDLFTNANSSVSRTVRASFTSVASDPSVSTVTSHSPTFDRNPATCMPAVNANLELQAHAKTKAAAIDNLLRTASDDSASTFEESAPFSAASYSWAQEDALDQLNQRAVVWNLNAPGLTTSSLATQSAVANGKQGVYLQF